MKRALELLAPAKNLACGLAAIDHGADAVYIGGPQFSARAAAANSLADIEKLVIAAHTFRVKVYVALNTIFDDRELDLAARLAWQLQEIGVDALIIQDMGLLECHLPPIPLHASTQTNNRTISKVQFLENVGFRQVVLARELSLMQIRAIRAATTATLEFFVHGALCVSYSGQCYMSEVVAGRSANRGECAQFCRHKYTLRDGRGKILVHDRYLLSMRDLDLSAHLADLIAAGIDSFKIEGRLKGEAYVKNVTAFYRQALDELIEADAGLARKSSGRCSFSFVPDTAKSFNRGKTNYFLKKKRNRPGALESPKSTGQELGQVVDVGKDFFTLATSETINNGDGLCFFDSQGRLVGVKVNRVDKGKIHPKDAMVVPMGTLVYRNADTAFAKQLAGSAQCRTLEVLIELTETVDGLLMTLCDEDGFVSKTALKAEKEIARQAGTIVAMAERQLKKCGGTHFSVQRVEVDLQTGAFYSAAVFNELRRNGLDEHLAKRQQGYRSEYAEQTINDYPWPAEELGFLDNIGNSKALKFYQRHGVQRINRSRLKAKDIADCALMTCKYCIRAQLTICAKMGHNVSEIVEPLVLVDNTGEYQLGFDCDRCQMTVRKRDG
ncbi:MAG: U32 family peptidase [Proteobacteria bacterium]|nr:U32 family peptidase [Pseudomonadota bacterium]